MPAQSQPIVPVPLIPKGKGPVEPIALAIARILAARTVRRILAEEQTANEDTCE
jgi:hypothetical protein